MGQEGQTTAEYVAALALMATLVAGVAVAVEAPVRQGVATGFAEVCRLVGGRPERCPLPAGGAGGRLVDVDGDGRPEAVDVDGDGTVDADDADGDGVVDRTADGWGGLAGLPLEQVAGLSPQEASRRGRADGSRDGGGDGVGGVAGRVGGWLSRAGSAVTGGVGWTVSRVGDGLALAGSAVGDAAVSGGRWAAGAVGSAASGVWWAGGGAVREGRSLGVTVADGVSGALRVAVRGARGLANRAWHAGRAIGNAPVSSAARVVAEAAGADCQRAEGLMTVCGEARFGFLRGGTTYGNVFITDQPVFEVDQRLLRHETKHADQWALVPGFPVLYLTAEAVWPVERNPFERWAGLEDGCYVERPGC